jgi:hypothetical protein
MSSPVIFLSAATLDLNDWRDTLHAAFSRAGFHVLTQNHSLEAAPGGVRRLIVDTIAKADCVIHLAGMAYGSDATDPFPDSPSFKCSWTQFEYYHAHATGKDVIAFVCAPSLSKPFVEKGTTEAERDLNQALQEAHRSRVQSGSFEGTPLEGTSRASPEMVSSQEELLKAVAASNLNLRCHGGPRKGN